MFHVYRWDGSDFFPSLRAHIYRKKTQSFSMSRSLRKYEGNMTECEENIRNMKEIWKKYEGIWRKYEVIWRNMKKIWRNIREIRRTLPIHGLWGFQKFRNRPLRREGAQFPGLGVPQRKDMNHVKNRKIFSLWMYISIQGEVRVREASESLILVSDVQDQNSWVPRTCFRKQLFRLWRNQGGGFGNSDFEGFITGTKDMKHVKNIVNNHSNTI